MKYYQKKKSGIYIVSLKIIVERIRIVNSKDYFSKLEPPHSRDFSLVSNVFRLNNSL